MSVLPVIIKISEHKNENWNFPVRRAHVYCAITRKYYVISENKDLKEALVFNADNNGEIANYNEVDGGRNMTLEEVLAVWNPANHYKFDDEGNRIF